MVMLQSPAQKASSDNQPTAVGGLMSPNSNPDSPKSNTSPELGNVDAGAGGGGGTATSTPPKIPKFIISSASGQQAAAKQQEQELRFSIERLKQMSSESGSLISRLSPSQEDCPSDKDKTNHNNNNSSLTNHNNNSINGNQSRRSQSPPASGAPNVVINTNFSSPAQQRKLLELSAVRQLARPEPLQHPHAALLQQHPHLLQNPQFLAAAAAQQHMHHHHHHHLHQQHQPHPHSHPHQHPHPAAAGVFHLRAPSATSSTTAPPSPATSPLSPPTSPATHSEQPTSSPIAAPANPPAHSAQPQPQPAQILLSSGPQPVSPLSASDMDLERIKLVAAVAARSSQAPAPSTSAAASSSTSNSVSPAGRDLSDYGFRIQLGGLAAAAAAAAATSRQIAAANYARSDTSEELNVDGNDEDSNDGSHSTPSVCPVDLTRSVTTSATPNANSASTSASSDREAATKRLAFSVENILDPNKFTGNKMPASGHPFGHPRQWSYDRDEEMHERLDDDQSEDMSGSLMTWIRDDMCDDGSDIDDPQQRDGLEKGRQPQRRWQVWRRRWQRRRWRLQTPAEPAPPSPMSSSCRWRTSSKPLGT
ncbi:GL13783 [Drosophila persimilis]|uniref:GL13783 n=1 Tax=Drosophila persimilis TaxID=7234 RepID=B4GNZ3_DROPE|nr:GL13783 [Drosophila persimilis]